MFGQIQMQLRNDYLIRGICEREVDEVVRGSKEYETYFLPKALQWNFEGKSTSDRKSVRRFFACEALYLTEIEWKTVINCGK